MKLCYAHNFGVVAFPHERCPYCEELRRLEERIQQLLESGNVNMEAARAARRERDRARFEADVWSSRTLEAWASLRRIDPSYSQEASS